MNLSDRLRQGSECAPWVIDEVRKMEAENEALRADAVRLEWIEQAARNKGVQIASSVFGNGFEIGEWKDFRVTLTRGSLRDVIDRAMKEKP